MAFFERQTNQKYEKFSTEIGLLHNHYRLGAMLTTLRELQTDNLGILKLDAILIPQEVSYEGLRKAYNFCEDPSVKGSYTQSVNLALGAALSRTRRD